MRRYIPLIIFTPLLAWYMSWFFIAGNECRNNGGSWVQGWPTYTCIDEEGE